jgi:hypothetical protein
VFIDALHVKIRDGQVGPRPVYAAIGVDLAGHVLGMWASEGDGESAKYWLAVLTELKNRGVADIFFLVCDGLTGLPQSVGAVFPDSVVQTCIIHLIWGTFRYAGRQHRDAIAKAIKPIYTAVNAHAAAEALDAFDAEWRDRYPAAIRLWRNAWSEFIPVPGLRHRDQEGDLFDQRHRYLEFVPRCPRCPTRRVEVADSAWWTWLSAVVQEAEPRVGTMQVARVISPVSSRESWTVLGDDDAPIAAVDRYLAYLSDIERSPNTVKAYAHDLKDWFGFLAERGLDWRAVRLDDVGEFVAWLRLSLQARVGLVAVLPSVPNHCTESNVNRKLSAVAAFYTHAARGRGG